MSIFCSNLTWNTKHTIKLWLNVRWYPTASVVSQSALDLTEKGTQRIAYFLILFFLSNFKGENLIYKVLFFCPGCESVGPGFNCKRWRKTDKGHYCSSVHEMKLDPAGFNFKRLVYFLIFCFHFLDTKF